jgi:hypothetical protein
MAAAPINRPDPADRRWFIAAPADKATVEGRWIGMSGLSLFMKACGRFSVFFRTVAARSIFHYTISII